MGKYIGMINGAYLRHYDPTGLHGHIACCGRYMGILLT